MRAIGYNRHFNMEEQTGLERVNAIHGPKKDQSHADRQLECEEALSTAFREMIEIKAAKQEPDELAVEVINLARSYLQASASDFATEDVSIGTAFAQITKAAESAGWTRVDVGCAMISLALNHLTMVSEQRGPHAMDEEAAEVYWSAPVRAPRISRHLLPELADRWHANDYTGYSLDIFSVCDHSPKGTLEFAVSSLDRRSYGVYISRSREAGEVSVMTTPIVSLDATDPDEVSQRFCDFLSVRGYFD